VHQKTLKSGCGNSLVGLQKKYFGPFPGTLGSAKRRQARLPDATSNIPPPPLPSNLNSINQSASDGAEREKRMPQDEALMERLKASLWFSIGKIVDEETARLNTTATPQFIGAMTEMVWAQIGISPPLCSPPSQIWLTQTVKKT
jgi:hypothetical protein